MHQFKALHLMQIVSTFQMIWTLQIQTSRRHQMKTNLINRLEKVNNKILDSYHEKFSFLRIKVFHIISILMIFFSPQVTIW